MEKKTGPHYPFFIKSSFLKKKSNILFSKILLILFRKIKFDNESLTYLKEYKDKGLCVFTSFQCSQTSLLIFLNQLKKIHLNKKRQYIVSQRTRLGLFP